MEKSIYIQQYNSKVIIARKAYFSKHVLFQIRSAVLISLFFLQFTNAFSQVGISSTSITPDASSILELRSTSAGFLPPRMTTPQRDAILTPATGLLIYNTSTNQLNYYTGSAWQIVTSGSGVTSVSVNTANGISGTVANATTTPAITISTSVNGIAKGNGTALSAATAGIDYSAGTSGLATGILKSTTTTGALSTATVSDYPILNQNTTGNAATVTTNANLTGDVTSVGNGTTLATVNSNIGTFNSVTVNAKGLVTAATITTTELTAKTNADVNSTYPDNATYWSNVTIANGFPVNGNLSGVRKGTFNSQRLQDQLNGSTYARAWIEGTSSWTTWAIYLDGNDFLAKGQMHIASGNNSVGVLSVGTDGQVLTADAASTNGVKWGAVGNAATVTTNANLTGDVTSVGNATTIGANMVTNAKLAQMATNTIKGNNTGSTANASDLTVAQVNAILPTFTSSLNGLVPASGGGTDNFLRADGTFNFPVPGLVTMTSVSAAINTTETKLTSFVLPANFMLAGTTYRVTVFGTCTSTAANTSNIRVRLGTSGTSADAITAVITPSAATSGTAVPFQATFIISIRTTGTSGTAGGNGFLVNNNQTGISSLGIAVGTPTSGVVVNTTVANTIQVSYQSSAATTTSIFQIAEIEVVNK